MRIFHQCHCGWRPHELLGATQGICCHKGLHPIILRSASTLLVNLHTVQWQIELSRANGGAPWWFSKQEINEHYSLQRRDEDIGLCCDPQFISSDELDLIVRIEDHFPIRSLHTKIDQYMWTHIPPFDQEHNQKELQDNLALPQSHHGSHCQDKVEDFERSHHSTKRLSHWC